MLVFMSLSINAVFAGNQYSGIQILLGVIPEEQSMETKLDTLIYNLLAFELERYGLTTELTQFQSNDLFELILSEESDSGLAIVCSYTTNDKRVLMNLELFDTRTMLIIASSSKSADLDLSFDKAISSMVSDIMLRADKDLTARVVNMNYEGMSSEKEEDIIEQKTESENTLSVFKPKGDMEVFFDAGTSRGAGDSRNALVEAGLVTAISVNYWFFSSFGYFGIGIQATANLYSVTGQSQKASLLLFPIGISAGYSSPTDRLFSVLFQLGSGPAIASLIYEGADPLVKVIPYIGTNFGLSYNINKRMSLGLKAACNIYFEEASMLTTLSSSVYVSFRSWN